MRGLPEADAAIRRGRALPPAGGRSRTPLVRSRPSSVAPSSASGLPRRPADAAIRRDRSTMRDAVTDAAGAARPTRAETGPIRPPLVIGCGALARELVELTRRAGLPAVELTCLPASLHNRPERIPGAVAARIRRARADGYDRIFVAYADCGTGGLLDRMLDAEGVARLEGAHCYEVYAGRAAFAQMHENEPGTFYLTDFLARNFERLVIRGLGLDRHPELLPVYFGNYRRLVYLAQTNDAALTAFAESGARQLGLAFERRHVGLGELAPAIARFATFAVASAGATAQTDRASDEMFRQTAMPDAGDAAPVSSQVHGRDARHVDGVYSMHARGELHVPNVRMQARRVRTLHSAQAGPRRRLRAERRRQTTAASSSVAA